MKKAEVVWPESSLLAGSLGSWCLSGVRVSQNYFFPVLPFPFLLPQLAQVAAAGLRQRGRLSPKSWVVLGLIADVRTTLSLVQLYSLGILEGFRCASVWYIFVLLDFE